MNAIDKRLRALEAVSPVNMGEEQLGYLEWLSAPSFPVIVAEFVDRRARRHVGEGWSRLPDDERRARVAQEVQRLVDVDPIDWLGDDCEAFARRLRDHREMMDVHRGWDAPLAAVWRAQHRDWHARMSEAEFDAWERSRMRQT